MELKGTLEQIWQERNLRNIEVSYSLFLRLSAELSLPIHASIEKKADELFNRNINSEEVALYLLLEPSFLRAQNEFAKSHRKLDEIENYFSERSLDLPAEFWLQRGLNFWLQSHSTNALDCFNLGVNKATSVPTKLNCQFNRILCLEVLGYDFEEFFCEFNDDFSLHREESWAIGLRDQWIALAIRRAYLKSNFTELHSWCSKKEASGQGAYFLAWLQSNPIFGLETEVQQKSVFLKDALSGTRTWSSDFRLRTLENQMVTEDQSSEMLVSEKVDRLYLWVWQWLQNPQTSLLRRIRVIFTDILENLPDQMLSQSEYQTLENSCMWLALFLGISQKEVRKVLSPSKYPLGKAVPHLDYEKKFIDALFEGSAGVREVFVDSIDSLVAEGNRASTSLPMLRLAQSIARSGSCDLSGFDLLRSSLEKVVSMDRRKNDGITIDPFLKNVFRIDDGQIIDEQKSESFCRLVCLFENRDFCEKEELLEKCFEVLFYEPEIHDSKISNFLSRANRLFEPYIQFSTRKDQVYCQKMAGKVNVSGYNTHSAQILDSDILQSFVRSFKKLPEQSIDRNKTSSYRENDILAGDWVTRDEVGQMLRVSRATATRRLNKWLEKRAVIKRGVGKAIRYKFVEPIDELVGGATL